MTPERQRAHDRAAKVRFHIPGDAFDALVGALEENEYLRPLLVAARRVYDAKSGQARTEATEHLFEIVDGTRHLQVGP